MAELNSSARLRADAGLPTSGVIHVRTRLTAHFTVLANALVQRRGSAVTVGVAAYILSLPDGAPVSIAALCAHFTEGEILISRALAELEATGYLERRRWRAPGGQIRTRTLVFDVPGGAVQPAAPVEPAPAAAPAPVAPVEPIAPIAPPTPASPGPPEPPAPLPVPDSDAAVLLASLRIVDRRLILSQREVAELAPAVARWLAQGVAAEQVTELLTVRLPDRLRTRAARILAYRLSEPLMPVPALPAVPERPGTLPWQTCDGGCERAFRAAEPGCCRDCPPDGERALLAAC
ncbi:hypothetical protein QR77_22815 [Streptomyces sp. 150FB]|uniref:hypothetical protein n=1 Tax=Streptomyces sp. 150FB TaxID=1576605 RepID=UPI0005895BA9|nr:hypothetical protein [Streptomyces sp. 150FB]KIF75949.1 hypothetical protein QR77_22815 [Streptomyces sp. 150FB]